MTDRTELRRLADAYRFGLIWEENEDGDDAGCGAYPTEVEIARLARGTLSLIDEVERLTAQLAAFAVGSAGVVADVDHLNQSAFDAGRASAQREIEQLTKQRNSAVEKITFMRSGYSSFGARPCPACHYIDGVFQHRCKLHEQMDAIGKWGDEARALLPTKPEREALIELRGWTADTFRDQPDPEVAVAYLDRLLAERP